MIAQIEQHSVRAKSALAQCCISDRNRSVLVLQTRSTELRRNLARAKERTARDELAMVTFVLKHEPYFYVKQPPSISSIRHSHS